MEKAVIFRIHEFQDRRVLTMDGLVCTSGNTIHDGGTQPLQEEEVS